MPIYEFYCADCHMMFNFRSRRVDTESAPPCPRCEREHLARQVSLFAVASGRQETEPGDDSLGPLGDVDEARMERVMASLAGEMEGLDEDDPRQAARVMRKLYDATGLELGAGMEEAMRRMEAGEEPEAIERDLGDQLEAEEPLVGKRGQRLAELGRRLRPPGVDDTLYDLL